VWRGLLPDVRVSGEDSRFQISRLNASVRTYWGRMRVGTAGGFDFRPSMRTNAALTIWLRHQLSRRRGAHCIVRVTRSLRTNEHASLEMRWGHPTARDDCPLPLSNLWLHPLCAWSYHRRKLFPVNRPDPSILCNVSADDRAIYIYIYSFRRRLATEIRFDA